MTSARTTVVIATRNRCAELARTLGELSALRPRPPIIVVDNDSTDATADTVTTIAGSHDGIQLIRLSRNAGATARNAGVAAAGTPYVAFSDDDSWWAPGSLAAAERILDEHPSLGLLAARPLVGPGSCEDPVTLRMARSPLGREPSLPGPSVLGFVACAAIVRRAAFLEVGGFSPVLHFVGEESLLAYDLAAAGWQLCYVDSLRAHHHPSRARSGRVEREVRELRNHALVAWLRRPVPVALRHGLGLLARAPRHPAAGLAAAAALLKLPAALAARRRLPDDVERRIRVLERLS